MARSRKQNMHSEWWPRQYALRMVIRRFPLPLRDLRSRPRLLSGALCVSVFLAGIAPCQADSFDLIVPSVFLHETEEITLAVEGTDPASVTVDLDAVGDSGSHLVVRDQPANSPFSWDTTLVPDDCYELEATFRIPVTGPIGNASAKVSVNNTDSWHRGVLTSSETWGAGTHIVEENVTVPASMSLSVSPDAVVKFVRNTGITIEGGATLDAPATAGNPITFTALEDNSVRATPTRMARPPFPSPANGSTSRPRPEPL